MISADLRTWLKQQIDANPEPQGPTDWVRAVAREHRVMLMDGDNAGLWFLSEMCTLYYFNRDAALPRLEEATFVPAIRSVFEKAAGTWPQLEELLRKPPVALGGGVTVTSPDGKWRAEAKDDVDGGGADVTVLTLFDAETGRFLRELVLNFPELRLVRFLAAQRILMATRGAETFFEIDFNATPSRWQVIPALVRDEY